MTAIWTSHASLNNLHFYSILEVHLEHSDLILADFKSIAFAFERLKIIIIIIISKRFKVNGTCESFRARYARPKQLFEQFTSNHFGCIGTF